MNGSAIGAAMHPTTATTDSTSSFSVDDFEVPVFVDRPNAIQPVSAVVLHVASAAEHPAEGTADCGTTSVNI